MEEEENDFNFQENSSLDLLNNIFNTEEEEKLDEEEKSPIGPVALTPAEDQQEIIVYNEVEVDVSKDNFIQDFFNENKTGKYDTETRMVPTVVTIEDPKDSDFYIKTKEVLKAVSEIQQNPALLNYNTISVADQLRNNLVNPDGSLALTDGVRAINVEQTMSQVNESLEELPKILVANEVYDERLTLPAEISVDKLTSEQVFAIRKYNDASGFDRYNEQDEESGIAPNEFDEARTQLLIDPFNDWINDNPDNATYDAFMRSDKFPKKELRALAAQYGVEDVILPEGITNDMEALYSSQYSNFTTKEEIDEYNNSMLGLVKIPITSGDNPGYIKLDNLEQLNENFKLNPEAFNYIREEILTNVKFQDYGTWSDYLEAVMKFTPTLINDDPVNMKTITEANLNLQNEKNVKYIELLDAARADGSLNDPNKLEKINSEYLNWQTERFSSLIDSSDYEQRGLEYQYAVQKVLESVYTNFGRTKDPTFKDLDDKLKDGTYSKWWYKIRNTASGSYTKWKQGMKDLLFTTPYASKQSTLYNGVTTFNELAKDIDELGLGDMNEAEFMAWYDKNKFDLKNVGKYNKLKDKLMPLWDKTYAYDYGYETLDELRKDYNTKFEKNSKQLAFNISESVEAKYRTSLIPALGDDSSILGLVNELIDQSNMLFMFSGMALKQTKNPYAYGVGMVLDVLGSTDIVAKTMTGDMWAVLDNKIKERKGEDYIPNTADYMAELEDPDSINTIANVISTGAQFGMERFSLGKITKASTIGYNRVASVVRGQWKKYLATMPAFLTARELAGLSEYIVEGTQGLISNINQNLQGGKMSVFDAVSSGKFDFEGAKKGRRIARALPIVGMVAQQSAIELSQISAQIASRFNQKGNAAAVEEFYADAISKVQLDIKNNVVTKEQGNEQIDIISHYRNIGFKLPKNLNGTNRDAAIDLMVRKKKLQEYIKKVDDKDITSAEIEELGDVSFALQSIILQAKDKNAYIDQVGNVTDIINNNENAKVKIIRSKDDVGVENQIEKLNSEGWKIAASKGLTTNYGTIFQKGDKQVIILNDKQILADGAINTAAHEFLHSVLWNTVRNSKGTAIALGNSLVEYLNQIDPKLIKDSGLAGRIQQYRDDPNVTNEQQAEEVLTLFSEAVLDGAIDKSAFDGSYGQQIGEFFSRIFNSLIGRESDIRFNNGRDVYKFIKDYNKSIEKGKFTKAQDKLFEGRAEGDLVKREYKTKAMKKRDIVSKSSKGFDKTNELLANPDFEATNRFDQKQAVEAAGGVIEAATKRLWRQGSLLTRDQFKKALENEYIQALVEYDSDRDTGTGAGSSISSKFNLRAGGVAKANLGKGESASLDSEQARQVADTTEVKDFDETTTQESSQRKKVYASQTDQVGNLDLGETKGVIKDEVSKEILLSANKNINAADIARNITTQSKKDYFKKLRKDIGTFSSQKYKDFVNSLDKSFIKSLPVGTIKRRFGKLFGIKQTGITKTKQTSKTGKPSYFNKPVYNVPKVTNEGLQKFKDYFLAGEKRQQSLYSILTQDFALESIQELVADKSFMDKLQTALNNESISAKEFMQNIENKLDTRNLEDTSLDTVKASKKRRDELIKKADQKVLNNSNSEDVALFVDTVVNIMPKYLPIANIFNSNNFASRSDKFGRGQFITGKQRAELIIDALANEGDFTQQDINKVKVAVGAKTFFVTKNGKKQSIDYGSSKYQQKVKDNYDGLEIILQGMSNMVQDYPQTISVVNAIFDGASGNSGHFIRQAAIPRGEDQGFVDAGFKGEKEHVWQQNEAGLDMLDAIKNNTVSTLMPYIRDNYFMIGLSNVNNNKLSDVSGQYGTPFNFGDKLPEDIADSIKEGIKKGDMSEVLSIWGRYFNESVNNVNGGIDPNTITFDGKNVAEIQKVNNVAKSSKKNPNIKHAQQGLISEQITKDIDSKTASSRLKAYEPIAELEFKASKKNTVKFGDKVNNEMTVAEQLTMLGTYDKAASKARDLNAPKKGISVFDFDDTLAKTNSKVIVTMPESVQSITNTGDAKKVINTVYKSVINSVANNSNINTISFSSEFSEKSRVKLYNSLANKLSKDLGWELDVFETVDSTGNTDVVTSEDFTLTKGEDAKKIKGDKNAIKFKKDVADNLKSSFDINGKTYDVSLDYRGEGDYSLEFSLRGKSKGKTYKINATEFAEQSADLEAQGAEFNFDEFSKVIDGKKGPLADLALKRQGKFGSKDIFVLTARPQIAATGIKKFLDGIGLNLPLANITGLENGTPGAKGDWVAQKAAEGYNDFYFADDAYKNVEAVQEVLSQVDVDSEVQIAKSSKKRTFDKIFNDILESSTGIESYKEYSAARAKTIGASKGRFSFFNTPSAEDFLGLLYKTLGKGKIGDAQMAFYKTNLLDPYNRAELAVTKAKITAAAAFKALKSNLKSLPKSLSKQTGIGGFTFSQASRVAAWTRQGFEIPGLSKRDIKELNDFVDNNAELNTFVDELIKIQKGKPYPKPGKNWLGGTITSDILNEINKVNRKAFLQEWQQNVDIIFSDKNMNKLEAAYGPNYVEALRDQLARMKSGSNRPIGGSRVVNNVLDWLNNSVGAVMFLNTRSAVLQTLSSVNFINFGNNNIYRAAKAFANQPQFWKDFKTLMNSPYLVERRNGLKINVSESEIADAVAEASNKPKAAISYLLNKGFIFTRIADSFAIASGGATFYRNQINAYVKGGMDIKEAEKRAFDDFYAIAEENQQSSNPSKISQQQASGAGRVILAFANTPMQYARIIKRSIQDLANKRGDWKSNISKIVYYGAIQNLAFNALQSALFAEAFGEDEEEDEKLANREGRIANGMADSLLRGLGIQGAAISALKNSLITIANENDKKSPKFVKAVYDLFDFSPPLDSKFRKLRSGANTITWERENIKNKGFDLNNPGYLAFAQIVSGLTNLPLDRAIQKMNNIRAIMSNSSQNWQKVALTLGWSTWDVGLPYYGVEDKVEMTPQMILKEKVIVMKKETSTKQQKEMLLKLGLTKQQVKDLQYEEARVKKIIELQEKNKK